MLLVPMISRGSTILADLLIILVTIGKTMKASRVSPHFQRHKFNLWWLLLRDGQSAVKRAISRS